jgi:heme-degrading monooxygenase HmoA
MTVRVMVFAKILPGHESAFESAYADVYREVRGTPGLIDGELLRDTGQQGSYILLSEWESEAAFLAWENDPIHRGTTTPMRPHWAGHVERKIYDVAVRLD